MRVLSAIVPCLLLTSFSFAQRGVDFREKPDTTKFTQAQIEAHLEMMVKHNIQGLSIDDELNENSWTDAAKKFGITIHADNQRFYRTWLNDCVSEVLEPTPALIQLKKDYQPVEFSFSGKNILVTETSERFKIEDLNFTWALHADGRTVESGEFNAEADSTGRAVADLSMKTAPHDKQTYLLEVHAFTMSEHGAIPSGHEVAKEQFRLSSIRKKALKLSLDDKLSTKENQEGIIVKGNHFKYSIDAKTGLISSLRFDGREFLDGSVQPAFYFPNEAEPNSPWNHGLQNWNLTDFKYQQSNEYLTTVISELQADGSSTVKMHYKIYGSGDCQVTAEFYATEELPAIQRFGLIIETAVEPDSIKWFGRGPQSSYHGANSAAFVGMNKSAQDELRLSAKEKTDRFFSETDWISIHKNDEAAFFSSKSPFSTVVSDKESKRLGFFIDEMGLEKLRPERTVPEQRQRFSLRIRPFVSEDENALKLSRYHAGSMQVPKPKTAVGVTNDPVE